MPPVPARARTHRNPLQSRSKGKGVYPNPRRRKIVALKGSFCVGLSPVPGLLPPLPPLPELPPLPSCPPLCPRCCPAAAPLPLPELPDVPRCPGATFGMECDGPPGSGSDQPDQNDNGHPIGVLLQQRPKCCSTLNSLALDDLGGACYNNNIFFPYPQFSSSLSLFLLSYGVFQK
jgi:hypothetical protein